MNCYRFLVSEFLQNQRATNTNIGRDNMFRRKEEGLFDNETAVNQEEIGGEYVEQAAAAPATAQASATVQTPTAQPTTFGSNSAYNSNNSTAPRQNSSAPTASSFRPTNAAPVAPAAADAPRARLPEAGGKQATAINSPAVASIAASIEKVKTAKRVLTVGNDILLKGEIATCDRLVIEGQVDATLNDVHTVEIAECGSFKGSAQIEDAEISGLFEGNLTVRGRLVIYATGKVRGTISYGEIEIERGGELSGEIKMASSATRSAAKPAHAKDDKVAA